MTQDGAQAPPGWQEWTDVERSILEAVRLGSRGHGYMQAAMEVEIAHGRRSDPVPALEHIAEAADALVDRGMLTRSGLPTYPMYGLTPAGRAVLDA